MRLSWFLMWSLAGCFPTDVADGVLQCNPNPERACPRGYLCAANQRCYRAGHVPDLGDADLSVPEVMKHRGEACGPGDVCDTGQCVDGFCCNDPCGDPCRVCNLPTSQGTCDNVPFGMPPAHSACVAQDASTCGRDGLCDGLGRCELWPDRTICQNGSCAAGTELNASRCNGSGSCVVGSTIDCDPYVCRPDGGVCYDSCTGSAECNGNVCNTTLSPGSCGPKSLGGICSVDGDCKSGNCVDGLCCDTPLSMCQGCKACNVTGSEGHCANVLTGTDPHGACANVICADKCANGSCRPAPTTTQCAASCTNTAFGNRFMVTAQFTNCNGVSTGVCNGSSQKACPNGLTCASATTCKPSCAVDVDCEWDFFCQAGSCLPRATTGASCTRNVECLSDLCSASKCVDCLSDADCAGGHCDATGRCSSCSTTLDCTQSGWGTSCDTEFTGRCLCGTSQDCKNPNAGPSCVKWGSPTGTGGLVCGCGSGGGYCGHNSTCINGRCAFNPGEPCIQAKDCVSGSCSGGICQ